MRTLLAGTLLAAAVLPPLLLTRPTAAVGEASAASPPVASVVAAAPRQLLAPTTRPLPWDVLEFSVRRFLLLSGQLTLRRTTAILDDEGPLRGCMVDVIQTESAASAVGHQFGSMRTVSFLDPETGGTLAYHEEKVGERLRRLTFGPEGYRERVYRAAPGQETAPSSSWPLDEDRRHPYRLGDGTPVPPGAVLRDYYNMIADLGRLDLQAVGSTDYFVPTKEHVVRFRAEFGERATRKLTVRDLSRDSYRDVTLPVRRLHLTPEGENAAELGGFFAMEGGAEIWLSERSGLLLVIAGQLPQVPGRTEIQLAAAWPATGVPFRQTLGR